MNNPRLFAGNAYGISCKEAGEFCIKLIIIALKDWAMENCRLYGRTLIILSIIGKKKGYSIKTYIEISLQMDKYDI